MKLEILSVPDCPNVAPLQQRLDAVLADRDDVQISTTVIDTTEQAATAGMHGSPTLLLDGVDPFAADGQPTSVSCRLYRNESGAPVGAPSIEQLRAVLTGSAQPMPTAVADCCAPGPVDSGEGLRLRRARTAPADPADRAIHHAILTAFAGSGAPPAMQDLRRVAAGHGIELEGVLARLHEADVIRLDAAGTIVVAYPFSTTPTRHRVELASGVGVWAMCAIDALGMPAMLGTDAMITSTDPTSDTTITVTVHDGHYLWDPPTAAVFYSAAAGTGPSADCCCADLNTFTTAAAGQAWMAGHPGTPGQLLDTAAAAQLGVDIFGNLLSDD